MGQVEFISRSSEVQVNKRTTLYLTLTEDTKPNKGGYFCQVYADPELKCELESFTIENSVIRGADNPINRAKVVANSRVKAMYE